MGLRRVVIVTREKDPPPPARAAFEHLLGVHPCWGKSKDTQSLCVAKTAVASLNLIKVFFKTRCAAELENNLIWIHFYFVTEVFESTFSRKIQINIRVQRMSSV